MLTINRIPTDPAVVDALVQVLWLQTRCLARHGRDAARRIRDDERRAIAVAAHALGWDRCGSWLLIATVATVRRWHRRLILAVEPPQRRGRPRLSEQTRDLIIQLARDGGYANTPWGRRRILGELIAQQVEVSLTSIRRVLARAGIPPSPDRRSTDELRQWLVEHHADTAGMDFCQVRQVHAATGVVTASLYVLVLIHLRTRRVHLAGITEHPVGPWMAQQARNLTMDGGWLGEHGVKHLVCDRDTIITEQFRNTVQRSGVEVKRIPPQCPWWNGTAERVIKTLRHDLFDHCRFTSAEAVGAAVRSYLEHYHERRPHQGIDNGLIVSREEPIADGVIVVRRECGGLVSYTERQAAA